MTVYANLVDGKVKGVYDLIPKFWNGINNFNILCQQDPEFMKSNGFTRIVRDNTVYNHDTHYILDINYTVEGDTVYEHLNILSKPSPTRDDLLYSVRQKRDNLMKEFEWRYVRYQRQVRMGLPTTDIIENLDVYMQALADITATEDLTNLVWPVYTSSTASAGTGSDGSTSTTGI